MDNRTNQGEQPKPVLKWVLIAGLVSIAMMFGLEFYFWGTCPTVSDAESGRVYPEFDKFHSHYVYLTEMQNFTFHAFFVLGGICIASYVIVNLVKQKSAARSAQEQKQSQGPNQDDIDKSES
jgi:hypothetical protein